MIGLAVFPSLFDFGFPPKVPEAFIPTRHIFYGSKAASRSAACT